MAIILMTWENPSDPIRAKEADERAKIWRATVLKQKGLVEYDAYIGVVSASDMAVDSFASAADASAFLGSKEFFNIVSEMKALGVRNIQTSLWDHHPDVPKTLRP